jgi:hypothetical protein
MVSRLLTFTFCLFTLVIRSQEVNFQAPLVRASATIAPGWMWANKAQTIYIPGFLEFMLTEKYALRGDTYQFIDATYEGSRFQPTFMNRLFFGGSRYFGKNNWRHYLGIQTGLTVAQFEHSEAEGLRWLFSPSYALRAGTSFYVWKYFHFFGDVSYLGGRFRGLNGESLSGNEVVISFGLGFQLGWRKS